MGATVPPTMSPERVGRMPQVAAIRMNTWLSLLKRMLVTWGRLQL